MSNLLKEIKRWNDKFTRVIVRNEHFITALVKTSVEVGSTIQQFAARAEEIHEQLLRAAKPTFDLLQQITERTKRDTQRCAQIMLECAWPPETDMAADFAAKVIRIYGDKGKESAETYIRTYMMEKYDEIALEDVYRNWTEAGWLDKRLPLLREALDAHHNGLFGLSVPVILAQTEGAVADGYGHQGFLYTKPRGGKTKEPSYIGYVRSLLSGGSAWDPDQVVESFFLDFILEGFEHGVIPTPTLSRHAILHGADVAYNTAENSLKAILLFHYIQDRFRLVSLKGSDVYHLMRCHVLTRTRGQTRVHYRSHHQAKSYGRRPCKHCKPDRLK